MYWTSHVGSGHCDECSTHKLTPIGGTCDCVGNAVGDFVSTHKFGCEWWNFSDYPFNKKDGRIFGYASVKTIQKGVLLWIRNELDGRGFIFFVSRYKWKYFIVGVYSKAEILGFDSSSVSRVHPIIKNFSRRKFPSWIYCSLHGSFEQGIYPYMNDAPIYSPPSGGFLDPKTHDIHLHNFSTKCVRFVLTFLSGDLELSTPLPPLWINEDNLPKLYKELERKRRLSHFPLLLYDTDVELILNEYIKRLNIPSEKWIEDEGVPLMANKLEGWKWSERIEKIKNYFDEFKNVV